MVQFQFVKKRKFIVRKDKEIEPNLSILAQSIEKRQPFENEGVVGILEDIPQ